MYDTGKLHASFADHDGRLPLELAIDGRQEFTAHATYVPVVARRMHAGRLKRRLPGR